jgi:hypothetical protein
MVHATAGYAQIAGLQFNAEIIQGGQHQPVATDGQNYRYAEAEIKV